MEAIYIKKNDKEFRFERITEVPRKGDKVRARLLDDEISGEVIFVEYYYSIGNNDVVVRIEIK